MASKSSVQIVEVGCRDGLQNESVSLSVSKKVSLIKKLSDTGLKRIEVGSFVSPKWVPQMANSSEVVQRILKLQKDGELPRATRYSCLVPNQKGMEDALKTDIKEIAIFGACSESFSQKNINCSVAESFNRFKDIMEEAKKRKILVRGYLSTAFGCPYEGNVSEARVVKLAKAMLKLGVYEVSIGDTIGVATPKQVESLIRKLKKVVLAKQLAMHFHDTRGTALANVLKSYELGIRTFDTSVGGLGGCPYAKGAAGNLATEDLVYMLSGMGVKMGIDLEALIKIRKWIEKELDHQLPAKVSLAGLPRS